MTLLFGHTNPMKTLRIATRKSSLALWQANHVSDLIQKRHGDLECQIVPIITEGDRKNNASLREMGGKGAFVKELERALIKDTADIAVHSMKDMPVILPEELDIGAVTSRANPMDAFISNKYSNLYEMPSDSNIGSSSMRRVRQLQTLNSKLTFSELRGNIETRLQKLDSGKHDAIILAVAGITRLGLKERISEILDLNVCVPAAGQGAIGIEIRKDRHEVRELVESINDRNSLICVSAERELALQLGASCDLPIGIYAGFSKDSFSVQVFVCDHSGETVIREAESGNSNNIPAVVSRISEKLRRRGSEKLLKNDKA